MADYFYDPQKGKHLMLTESEYVTLKNLVLDALHSNPSSNDLKQILFQLS